MGEVCRIPDGLECCLGQRMVLLRIDRKKIDGEFLLYALQSPTVQEQIRWNEGTGSTVSNLRIPVLEALVISVPEPPEQRAIARILVALDAKIELNRRTNETLEAMARALFKSWFVDLLERSEIADRIVSDLSGEGVLQVGDGYRAKNDEMASSGLPFARAGNINNGFNFDRADLLGEPGVAKAGDKVSRPFDVVFTSKGTVGRFAFVDSEMPPFVYSPQLCFWRSTRHDVLDPFVLRQWMASRWFLDQVDRVKGQTDMAEYVSLRDQRTMRFPLAPPEAQQEVSGQLRGLQKMVWKNEREAATLQHLRDGLLPRLLSGDLIVPDEETT